MVNAKQTFYSVINSPCFFPVRSLFFVSVFALLSLFFTFTSASASASTVISSQEKPLRIAVSTNFLPALQKIIPTFEKKYHLKTQLIASASGVLFQQIRYGAPFDIFLSADESKPRLLEAQKLTVQDSRLTYAIGQLALFNNNQKINDKAPVNSCLKMIETNVSDLNCFLEKITSANTKFAIANPKLAPYGLAAKQALKTLGFWGNLQKNLVLGTNVGQTFQQIRSKVINNGLVAHSQLVMNNLSGIIIPKNYYQPIEQQLVVLRSSKQVERAKVFVQFLLSTEIQERIANMGYLPSSAQNTLPLNTVIGSN